MTVFPKYCVVFLQHPFHISSLFPCLASKNFCNYYLSSLFLFLVPWSEIPQLNWFQKRNDWYGYELWQFSQNITLFFFGILSIFPPFLLALRPTHQSCQSGSFTTSFAVLSFPAIFVSVSLRKYKGIGYDYISKQALVYYNQSLI